jgi:hypothetical protein
LIGWPLSLLSNCLMRQARALAGLSAVIARRRAGMNLQREGV